MKNKKNKYCFRCGTKLTKLPVQGYTYYCPCCDEDFYKFEQTRTEIKRSNHDK